MHPTPTGHRDGTCFMRIVQNILMVFEGDLFKGRLSQDAPYLLLQSEIALIDLCAFRLYDGGASVHVV